MMVRGTPIIAATNAQNGVIYVINKVMTDETTSGSLLEELASHPEVSTFYNYLSRSPISRKLQGKVISSLIERKKEITCESFRHL